MRYEQRKRGKKVSKKFRGFYFGEDNPAFMLPEHADSHVQLELAEQHLPRRWQLLLCLWRQQRRSDFAWEEKQQNSELKAANQAVCLSEQLCQSRGVWQNPRWGTNAWSESGSAREAPGNTLNVPSLHHSKHNLIHLPKPLERFPLGERQRHKKHLLLARFSEVWSDVFASGGQTTMSMRLKLSLPGSSGKRI